MVLLPVDGLARYYGESRRRILGLVSELDGKELERQVPCCPAWSVRQLLAHLTASAEEALAGRLLGPPSDEETAAQLAAFAGWPVDRLLEHWERLAASLQPQLAAASAWPLFLDVLAHEHDLRGALGKPGSRDEQAVELAAERLLTWLRPPRAMVVLIGERQFSLGPEGEEAVLLRTTAFEAFRWRLGRRSRNQLLALDWSEDPKVLLDSLCVFGPAPSDIIE